MDNILRTLGASQTAVDLGCGGGSFDYAAYRCRIIGVDIALNAQALYRDGNRVQYVRSVANGLPLESGSVDAVICNHTFEHFPDYKRTLAEINRVLNANGLLWISIPNGYSFDDALYRLLFHGGGHINRFSHEHLVEDVQTQTDLKLVQSISLFSGFVYLKKPSLELLSQFPRLKFLFYIPEPLVRFGILMMNATTRLADRLLGSRLSRYGWGFLFARSKVPLDPLLSYFNVCWKCGCGNDASHLKATGRVTSVIGVPFYSCARCETKSIYFEPPDGLS